MRLVAYKTVRIEIKGTEFGGTFYYNRTDHVFFQCLGEKNEKPFFVTRNRGDTMGVSSHGIFFRLWAVRARSARRRSLTTPGRRLLLPAPYNRTRLLIRAASPNFFSTRGLWKRGPQKRVARAQKLVVADLP